LLSSPAAGPALADGGTLSPDLQRELPEADWGAVFSAFLLVP